MFYDTFDSPIGIITLATDGVYIRELHIEGDRYFKVIPDSWKCMPTTPILVQGRRELEHYFKAKNYTFSLPILYKGTEFQEKVWRELQAIPTGKTVGYAELAQRVGRPGAARAVGTAVGHNPICIIVPCHRVIASSGGLGGYVAGLERKQYLLKHEYSLTRQ